MRLLRTIAALSAALTPLMAEAAFSRPMPGTADFPTASNPQVNVPVCFLETPSGTTLDLVSLCGSNARSPKYCSGCRATPPMLLQITPMRALRLLPPTPTPSPEMLPAPR